MHLIRLRYIRGTCTWDTWMIYISYKKPIRLTQERHLLHESRCQHVATQVICFYIFSSKTLQSDIYSLVQNLHQYLCGTWTVQTRPILKKELSSFLWSPARWQPWWVPTKMSYLLSMNRLKSWESVRFIQRISWISLKSVKTCFTQLSHRCSTRVFFEKRPPRKSGKNWIGTVRFRKWLSLQTMGVGTYKRENKHKWKWKCETSM